MTYTSFAYCSGCGISAGGTGSLGSFSGAISGVPGNNGSPGDISGTISGSDGTGTSDGFTDLFFSIKNLFDKERSSYHINP